MKTVIVSLLVLVAMTDMAHAKTPAYKCVNKGKVTYSEAPCNSPATIESTQSTASGNAERVRQIPDVVRRKEYPANYYDSANKN